MHWIIEDKSINAGSYKELLDALINKNIPFTIVNLSDDKKKIIPFNPFVNDEKECSEPSYTENIVLGTHDLVLLALSKKWIPGAFLNSNFEHNTILIHCGKNLLNFDAEIKKISEIKKFDGFIFIRPIDDSKLFDGAILNSNAFNELKNKILNSDTEVILAPVKEIIAEYRIFIVNGKIVTGSQYKKNKHSVFSPIIPNEALYFVTNMIQIWQPSKAFTLDIALTNLGYKIIEINCLNSSDFYASDIIKVVNAIEMLNI